MVTVPKVSARVPGPKKGWAGPSWVQPPGQSHAPGMLSEFRERAVARNKDVLTKVGAITKAKEAG